MRIYLQTPMTSDGAARFYHLFLQQDLLGGWSLVREWGFQGASGRLQRDHYPTQEAAAEALLKARDQQISRGYRVMFMQGTMAPPGEISPHPDARTRVPPVEDES